MSKTNKVRTLSFRLAEDDYRKLAERCRKAELSKSMYLRYLIRIPIVCDEATEASVPCVVLDKRSIRDISRELTRWGYHYNQAVHAMNSINYYIALGKSNSRLLDEKTECIEVELATVNRNAERIVYEIAKLQDKMIVEAQ